MDHEDKHAARAEMRRALRNLEDAQARKWSSELVRGFVSWATENQLESSAISLFAALPGEPDLRGLHESLRFASLHYPIVVGDRLEFHLVRDPATLRSGSFGILEPDPALHPRSKIGDLDLFLCPALAFSRHGTRLGRGKGYYDRALSSRQPDAWAVGVGYGMQIRSTLPLESHDIRMDWLATETGVISCKPDALSPLR